MANQKQIKEYIITLTINDILTRLDNQLDILSCEEVKQQLLEKIADALPYGLKVTSCEIEGMTQEEIDDFHSGAMMARMSDS